MTDLVQRLAELRRDVAELQRGRVTHRLVQVTSADAGTSTFAADLPDGQPLAGLSAPPQFLPAPGEWVRLRLEGATPIYDPAGIAEDAVTGREIAPGAVDTGQLSPAVTTTLTAANGKTKATWSQLSPVEMTPTPTGGPGDIWYRLDGFGLGRVTEMFEYRDGVWGSRQLNDTVVASLTAGKLVAGTVSADITIAGRFATALTGTRVEVNALGFQAWNGSTQTVSITGSTNLLTGTLKTATSGRRIEMMATGNTGRASFIAPDGTTGLVESWTQTSGEEAIRLAMPLSTTDWGGWNGISFQTNDRAYLATGYMLSLYGGGSTGTQAFEVGETTTRGTTAAGPTWTTRILADPGRSAIYGPNGSSSFEAQTSVLRMFVGDVNFEGSVDVVRHGVADTLKRSPRLLFRGEGGTVGHYIKFIAEADSTSPRLEIRNSADTAYGTVRGLFEQNSAREGKTNIADFTATSDALLDKFRPRVYQRLMEDMPGGLGPLEVGFVADELPTEVLSADGSAVQVYSLATVALAGVKWLRARLNVQAGRITTLENRVAKLETIAGAPKA